MKIVKEFREFAIKGNMFDMAIGIIVGTAFNKLVSSLVKDIIMPPFGYMLGKFNFREMKYILNDTGSETDPQNIVSINYGLFLELALDFLLITITIFFVIKCLTSYEEEQKIPK